jgi:hypothetical protein
LSRRAHRGFAATRSALGPWLHGLPSHNAALFTSGGSTTLLPQQWRLEGLPVVTPAQSTGHEWQSSSEPQVLSPQLHAPQSEAQLSQVSFGSQVPSPQDGQGPQSAAQLLQLSVPLHVPSPQLPQ